MFSISLDVKDVEAQLKVLDHFMADKTDVMEDIGNYLVTAIRERIVHGGPAPDGTPWAPKKAATLARYKAKGEGVDSRTLIHTNHLVQEGISHDAGPDFVEVFASPPYAAAMHFGAKRGSFGSYSGTDKRGRAFSGVAPWGDIPARPFLGISDDDEREIIDLISEGIARQLGAALG